MRSGTKWRVLSAADDVAEGGWRMDVHTMAFYSSYANASQGGCTGAIPAGTAISSGHAGGGYRPESAFDSSTDTLWGGLPSVGGIFYLGSDWGSTPQTVGCIYLYQQTFSLAHVVRIQVQKLPYPLCFALHTRSPGAWFLHSIRCEYSLGSSTTLSAALECTRAPVCSPHVTQSRASRRPPFHPHKMYRVRRRGSSGMFGQAYVLARCTPLGGCRVVCCSAARYAQLGPVKFFGVLRCLVTRHGTRRVQLGKQCAL